MEVSSALALIQGLTPPRTGQAAESGAQRQPFPPREAPPQPPAQQGPVERPPAIQGELIQPSGLGSGNAGDGSRGFLLGTPSNRTPNGDGPPPSPGAARDGLAAYEEEQGNAYVAELRTSTIIDLYV